MKNRINSLRRPSPAMIISMIALFVVLGGSAVALKGKNTVNSGDVVNNSLKSKDLKDGKAVRTQDVVNGSLGGADVTDDGLTGSDIDESSLGQVSAASNAANLGGFPASAYQRSCQPGAVAAYVYVKGSPTFPISYTSSSALLPEQFNCTGNPTQVAVRRTATGTYLVRFPGVDTAGHLVATGNVTVDSAGTQDNNNIVTYKLVDDPGFGTVYRVETANGGGTLQDREFSFSVDG